MDLDLTFSGSLPGGLAPALRSLPALRRLALACFSPQDCLSRLPLTALAALTSLELQVGTAPAGDSWQRQLATLPLLRSLSLWGVPLTDALVRAVPGCVTGLALTCSGSAPPAGPSCYSHLTALAALAVTAQQDGPPGRATLARVPGLPPLRLPSLTELVPHSVRGVV